jgi:hypothetical protein
MTTQSITHNFYILTNPATQTWLDITDDVLYRGRQWEHGIQSSAPLDRIADVGMARFYLRNDAQSGTEFRYTPGHVNCIPGFSVKTVVAIRAGWNGHSKVVFLGRIPPDGITQPSAANQANIVGVTAFDWFYSALNQTVTLAPIGTNKTLGDVATDLLSLIELKPNRVDIGDCEEVFTSTNETVRENTTIYTELNKALLSEIGYAYIKYEVDSPYTDILKVEGRKTRAGVAPYMSVDYGDGYVPGQLLKEDNDGLLLETGDKLLLDQMDEFDSIDGISSFAVQNGAHFTNRVLGKCYPKKIGSTAEIYRLQTPLSLKAGETRDKLRVRYLVEDGYVDVAASNVSLKSKAMYSDSGGTVTDLSSSLTVTGTYGAGDAELTLVNGGTVDGYVVGAAGVPGIILQGDPIYIGDTITQIVDIATEGSEYYGHIEMTLDQKYQSDPQRNYTQTEILANRYSERLNTIQSIDFCANASNVLAGLYLLCDVGSKIPLKYEGAGVDDYYYIQGVKIWQQGNATFCRYIVKPAGYDNYLFWQLGVAGYSELGETTVLAGEND